MYSQLVVDQNAWLAMAFSHGKKLRRLSVNDAADGTLPF
jgi:hypothetical protein